MAGFADVLEVLARNDGACLYWQMPNVERAKAALAAGAIKEDGDLLVHPEAVMVDEGMCYTMTQETEATLCAEFQAWTDAHGLPAMSAEELLHEDITSEQRKYLTAFINRWEMVV
jgi:hypothetical protein